MPILLTTDNGKATTDKSKATTDNSKVTKDNSKATKDNSKATNDNSKLQPTMVRQNHENLKKSKNLRMIFSIVGSVVTF